MSGRADSETPSEIAETGDEVAGEVAVESAGEDAVEGENAVEDAGGDAVEDADDPVQEARRARWAAAGTGGLLAFAGLAASVLRATDGAPALVAAAYALGAAVCAGAAVLGSRGRTRRALWLLVGGVMVMAFGDQFD
ncbi:hypothetical protein I2W78_11025 [Streptomyces spinoverrucosus]|uniref:hypothetical protein n=1 Tax=Streptomyces spinoverrucosus TaxID=284043 RepID=UPI0018C369A4|nr:hypothetical protein [Streptomyces spinoverrucosus]MBG0852349.1 hypothetical protein [Streptomyces spinoverrucosus]